jgi:hypothetical protein
LLCNEIIIIDHHTITLYLVGIPCQYVKII